MYFSPLNCSDCFFVISFSFYFLNALQKDIKNSNRVKVLGHKYVLGPSQTHFSPRLAARAKMSLSRAQNIFMPANIIVIISRNLTGNMVNTTPQLTAGSDVHPSSQNISTYKCRRIDWDHVGETTWSCRRNDLDVGESTCRRDDWHPNSPVM